MPVVNTASFGELPKRSGQYQLDNRSQETILEAVKEHFMVRKLHSSREPTMQVGGSIATYHMLSD